MIESLVHKSAVSIVKRSAVSLELWKVDSLDVEMDSTVVVSKTSKKVGLSGSATAEKKVGQMTAPAADVTVVSKVESRV